MGLTRILIIDDEENFCKLVKMNLELLGDLSVTIATNGKMGIKLAKKTKPDLILLDMLMPGMKGLEVLERLKKDENTMAIPVVMLSAIGDEPSKTRAMELYDEEYITKPIDGPQLKAKIEEVLRRFK
ncbi:MAG: response regulator [Candidatus Omnitrophica bacterium]|nr:response regulator [Candidatus Omnitrophota bacterium]